MLRTGRRLVSSASQPSSPPLSAPSSSPPEPRLSSPPRPRPRPRLSSVSPGVGDGRVVGEALDVADVVPDGTPRSAAGSSAVDGDGVAAALDWTGVGVGALTPRPGPIMVTSTPARTPSTA